MDGGTQLKSRPRFQSKFANELGEIATIALLIVAVALGLVNVLDILTDVVAIGLAGVSVVELGLLNSAGYTLYVPSLLIGGRLSESGVVRRQLLVAFISTVAYGASMVLFLETRSYAMLVACYLTYPVSIAFIRTSIYAYIHEGFPSTQWKKALTKRFVLTSITESLALIVVSHSIKKDLAGAVMTMLSLSVLTCAGSLLVVREPALKIERALYRIESIVEYIGNSLSGFLAYSLLSENALFQSKMPKRDYSSSISLKLLLLALAGFKLGSSVLLVPIPGILAEKLGVALNDVLRIYGVSRLVALATLLMNGSSKFKAFLYIARLPLWYLLANPANSLIAGFYLGSILWINGDVDIALYSVYVRKTLGKGTSRYILLGDLCSALGAALSGYVFKVLGTSTLFLALICSIPGFLVLCR